MAFTEALSEGLVSILLEGSGRFHEVLTIRSRGSGDLFPFEVGQSEEGDGVGEEGGFLHFVIDLVLIGNISIEDERGGIERGLESALGRPHRRAEL